MNTIEQPDSFQVTLGLTNDDKETEIGTLSHPKPDTCEIPTETIVVCSGGSPRILGAKCRGIGFTL